MKLSPFIAAVVLAASVTGCGSSRRAEPLVGKVDTTNPHIARGRLVFAQDCASCRRGYGAMPAFDRRRLPDDQLDDLVVYMKQLRKQDDHCRGDKGKRFAVELARRRSRVTRFKHEGTKTQRTHE